MGEAILRGLTLKKYPGKTRIFIADKDATRLKYLGSEYGVWVSRSNTDACQKSDIVIISVKPQDMGPVLEDMADALRGRLLISIVAGKRINFIKKKTRVRKIVRAMPNMPALAHCAMTALSYSNAVTRQDKRNTELIFNSIGKTVVLDERHMDAVTAVSGSGPAYLFLLMEAMAKSAVSLGIKKDLAFRLVTQTIFGASFLQYSLNKYPVFLKQDVASKGGTTEAALKVFKKRGFEAIVREAVKAAFDRSRQLA